VAPSAPEQQTGGISLEAARLALELRTQKRRTRSGLKNVPAVARFRPWPEVADELARQGYGRHNPRDVADAAGRLPLETHPEAPTPAAELEALEGSWRKGWAEEFPGEPWPGLSEARRRIRLKYCPAPTG
jgi:hypothetical protein